MAGWMEPAQTMDTPIYMYVNIELHQIEPAPSTNISFGDLLGHSYLGLVRPPTKEHNQRTQMTTDHITTQHSSADMQSP